VRSISPHIMATALLRQASRRLERLSVQMAPLVLGPLVLLRRPTFPESMSPSLLPVNASAPAPSSRGETLSDFLGGILLMAVPKKRISYTRKRVRQAGQIRQRGPQVQSHMYMCPVCERMRAPHRVCGREDCQTYFKHRWY
jgi:ribosomal protein L32